MLKTKYLPISFILFFLIFIPPVQASDTLYEYYNIGDDTYGQFWWDETNQVYMAQTFTVGTVGANENHNITTIGLKLYRIGEPGILTVSIRETNESGYPTGSDLTTGTIDADTLTEDEGGVWYNVSLAPYSLSADTKYAILLRVSNGNFMDNICRWRADKSSPTYDGGSMFYSTDGGSSWMEMTTHDGMFEERAVYYNISTCSVIDQGGIYYLTDNILNTVSLNCMQITANNVVLDCQGYTIDGTDAIGSSGIYISRASSTNTKVTVKNCNVTDWYWGFYLRRANNNTLTNIIANSNSRRGLIFWDSDFNTLTNITVDSNYHGLLFAYSDSNTLTNMTVVNSNYGGFHIDYSNSNIIKDSKIQNNAYGIYFYESGSIPNKVYNNLFNNTRNIILGVFNIYANIWNTTRQTGNRIYSSGPEIGGNYWTNPSGTGYSDTCDDTDKDGFCDSYYQLHATGPNIDYLPLSDEYTPSYCDVYIDNTTIPYNLNQDNTYYCLIENIGKGGVDGINFASGTQNSTLDCLGYNIDSNDTEYTSGVSLNGANIINNTIKNCNISDFYYGIYLPYSHNSTVADNILTSNNHGIHLCINTYDNLITRNNITGGDQGIYIHNNANSNNFTYNNINSVFSCGIQLVGNSNNLFANSSVSNSAVYDYCLRDTTVTNNFINMNWTEARKIYFYNSTPWFNYNNATDGIWLKTNVSATAALTRELINWNQNLMQWNDSASSAVTARYNITGLIPNTDYKVYDNFIFIPGSPFNSGPNGEINFTIDLPLNEEHNIKVQEAIPIYSINLTGFLKYTNGSAVENTQIKMIINYQTSFLSFKDEVTNTTDSNGFFYIIITNLPEPMFEPLPGGDFDIEFRVLGGIYKCNYDATTENCS